MNPLHNTVISHWWHWTGSKTNDLAESISNGVTGGVLQRADDCRVRPDRIDRDAGIPPLSATDLVSDRQINSDDLALRAFSGLARGNYSVRWVENSQDRCKGALAFRKHVGTYSAVAACLAFGQAQNVPAGGHTSLMHFLRVFPEATLDFVTNFKVGDKITFSLVQAVAESVLSGQSALRHGITTLGGGAVAVLIGTMIKSNPDMRAYMRSFWDPHALDRTMLRQLDTARQHLREASQLHNNKGDRSAFYANRPQTASVEQMRENEIAYHLECAREAILPGENIFLSEIEGDPTYNPLQKTFVLFSEILLRSGSVPVAYGYLIAGIHLYCEKKSEDYRRNASTAKLLLGIAGAAVSAFPPAAAGAAAAVAVGSAIADYAAEAKITRVNTAISRLRGRVSGQFGVSDATFRNAYDTAYDQGMGYV